MNKQSKSLSSFRMTPEAKDLLIQLAALQGISQSAVLEILIRQEARKRLKPAKEEGEL